MPTATFNRSPATTRTIAYPAPRSTIRVRSTITASNPWLAKILICGGLAMIPWLFYLGATLPSTTIAAHWDTVWVGLDAAEALGLLATGLLIRRGDPRCSLAATVTATLLTVDAWFDCGTAARGVDRVTAVLMAACLEIPLACLLAAIAWRTFPKPGR